MGHIAQVLGDVAGLVADTGIALCIEFNWSPVVRSFRTAAEIALRCGADNVGVLFDPAHYHCTPSKFEQLTAENVRTIRHVHVDDMRDKPGELCNCNADRLLPGEGCLNLSAIFGEIEAHGYNGYFALELFDDHIWSRPPGDSAPTLYRSMRALCD